MNITLRSSQLPLLACAIMVAIPRSSDAVVRLSQNFDTDPVNYTLPAGSAFVQDGTTPTKYWNLSAAVGASLNPNITGNTTTYLTGQDMDPPLPFTTTAPARMDFSVNVAGFTNLTLSIALAGLPSAEDENYVRAFTDNDGDGTYETPVFSFLGGVTDNQPYTETTTGEQLTPAFQTFANRALSFPTAADRNLRLRLELFNDTGSLNEAIGVDNILIEGIPEPTTSLLLLTGLLGFARRRAR